MGRGREGRREGGREEGMEGLCNNFLAVAVFLHNADACQDADLKSCAWHSRSIPRYGREGERA